MKRKHVEIFVVLAMLVAWAWYVKFNIAPTFLRKGQPQRAVSEISNIELALTKILSDAGRSSLRELFDPKAFQVAHAAYMAKNSTNSLDASVALYTRATYALLRNGRDGLTISAGWRDSLLETVQLTLNAEVVRSLGTSYISELGNDPWENPYQIFPGPWPEEMGTVLFRRALEGEPSPYSTPEAGHVLSDALTFTMASEPPTKQGLPAFDHMDFYIWSLGENEVSDQPIYDPTQAYAPPVRQHYRKDAPDEYLGGGDDISNWDEDMTFMKLYNHGR
jgi:hypothetical protein